MRTGTRRLVTVAVTGLATLLSAAAIAVFGAADPASAHSQLIDTEPAGDSTASQPLRSVRMTFNEPILARFSRVEVTGPGDVTYSAGPLTRIDNVVTQPLAPTRTGSYTVAWRIVSADGHPVTGKYRFRVDLHGATEPPAPSPQAAPHRSARADTGHWQLPATAGAIVVVAGVVTTVRRRRSAQRVTAASPPGS